MRIYRKEFNKLALNTSLKDFIKVKELLENEDSNDEKRFILSEVNDFIENNEQFYNDESLVEIEQLDHIGKSGLLDYVLKKTSCKEE